MKKVGIRIKSLPFLLKKAKKCIKKNIKPYIYTK